MSVTVRTSRQVERREAFDKLFPTMPLWETWTTTHEDGNGEMKERHHVKAIPRRVRRDMARTRSKRQLAHTV